MKSRNAQRSHSLVLLVVGLFFARASTAASLETLQGTWPELGLKAALSAPATPEVEQGADLQIRLSADAPANIAIVLEDLAHQVRIYTPHRPGVGEQLIPGTELLYPDLGFGETLYADAPVGRAIIWVIATDKAIFPARTEASGSTSDLVDEAAVARRIGEARSRGAVSQVTVARIPVQVVSPALKDFVSAQDFVSFYAVRTRSVSGADRGFRIGFKRNSAELDAWSRRQLEAVGEGMRDAQLAGYRFAVEGHTDDTGSDQYNLELSVRRAHAVRDFLAQQTRVPTTRLTTQGFGKLRPVAQGSDETVRAQNRRVVIRRLDGATP
jgi:outer membrane protein OmpA-like peptidoglycan-associated protein